MNLKFYKLLWLIIFVACDNHNAIEKENSNEKLNDSVLFNVKSPEKLPQQEVAENYSQAIAEYIKAVYTEGKQKPDTLYINGNDEFPKIELPSKIENINIKFMNGEVAENYFRPRKNWVLLNVIGWLTKNTYEFIIVTFFEDYHPQHNLNLYFKRTNDTKRFELDSLKFDYRYQ